MKKIYQGLAIAAVAAVAFAHDGKHGKKVEITGTVVDIACFVGHDSIGEKHTKCAEACARAGNPLAIYDPSMQKIYLPIGMDHKSPNAKLMPFVEKKVKVSGSLYEKGGLPGIAIEQVQAVQ